MFNYSEIETLYYVEKYRSISKAAEGLLITQAAASIRIKNLETLMGQPVLSRRSPPVLTSFGKKLVDHYSKVKLLEGEISGEFQRQTKIPLAINVESLDSWFLNCIKEFTEVYPDIDIEILIVDQAKALDLLNNGSVYACVSSKEVKSGIFKSWYIGNMNYGLYATEERALKTPLEKSKKVPVCKYDDNDDIHLNLLLKGKFKKLNFKEYRLPSTTALLKACLESIGYVALPEIIAKPYVLEGKIINVLPNEKFCLELYWSQIEMKSKILDELTKLLLKSSKKILNSSRA